MNTLKLGPAGHAASGPERSSRCSVDREAQHPRAALVIAPDATEQPARSAETSPRPQTHAKPKSFRLAIKVGGKILFINLCDVVSVQAKGKCVCLQGNASSYLLRESISVVAEALETHGFIRIHRSVLVNIRLVEEIRPLATGEYRLRVEGGKEYTVTRTYKKNLNSLADFWIGTGAFCPD
jgi:DNA-binding LytR/AlgR family response regulator